MFFGKYAAIVAFSMYVIGMAIAILVAKVIHKMEKGKENNSLLIELPEYKRPNPRIDLGQPKESPIYLEIGGYHWFTGKMGTHKKNMAVKIDEVCYQLEQRSE